MIKQDDDGDIYRESFKSHVLHANAVRVLRLRPVKFKRIPLSLAGWAHHHSQFFLYQASPGIHGTHFILYCYIKFFCIYRTFVSSDKLLLLLLWCAWVCNGCKQQSECCMVRIECRGGWPMCRFCAAHFAVVVVAAKECLPSIEFGAGSRLTDGRFAKVCRSGALHLPVDRWQAASLKEETNWHVYASIWLVWSGT